MPESTNDNPARRAEPQPDLTRSDPQTVWDGLQAVGIAAGGIGTLSLGAAAVKQAFGGAGEGQPQAPPPPPKED
jgi:hypothetical protein